MGAGAPKWVNLNGIDLMVLLALDLVAALMATAVVAVALAGRPYAYRIVYGVVLSLALLAFSLRALLDPASVPVPSMWPGPRVA